MTTATAVRERPILFSGPMVRAILDGRKTQTRRIIKPQPVDLGNDVWQFRDRVCISSEDLKDYLFHDIYGGNDSAMPYGGVYDGYGDRLWVRESFKSRTEFDWATDPDKARHYALYRADDLEADDDEMHWHDYGRWKPSIHMPRCLSRLTLELTDVRVERVQDIGKDGRKAADVLAEGITPELIEHERKWFHADDSPALAFARLWDSVNGAGSWKSNPWVWVLCFRRLEAA